MIDTYGYFSYVITRTERQEPILNSGLSYAFTKSLSRLLMFTGNLIDAVGMYQLVIQILWIVLLLSGISMLWGRLAGFVSSGILMVSPWILQSIFSVSPENYFLFYFSILLAALGYFHDRALLGEWNKRAWRGLYLKLVGFFAGVMCIWNYLGWLLPVMMVYVLICHFKALRGKIRLQGKEKELKNKERIMKVRTQFYHLFIGLLIGLSATLIKYTGLTGDTIADQFHWWTDQFKGFPERCQDVSGPFSMWFGCALLAGIFCQAVYGIVKAKKTGTEAEEQIAEAGQDKAPEVEAGQSVTPEDEEDQGRVSEAEGGQGRTPEGEEDQDRVSEAEGGQGRTPEGEERQDKVLESETQAKMPDMEAMQDEPENEEDKTEQYAAWTQEAKGWQYKWQSAEVSRETEAEEEENKASLEEEERKAVTEEAGDYVVTEDGRKVQLLENPLPVPKKHVKKDMEFDLEECRLEFDVEIREDDDFDL